MTYYGDLRSYIDALDAMGDIMHVTREVDGDFEPSAIVPNMAGNASTSRGKCNSGFGKPNQQANAAKIPDKSLFLIFPCLRIGWQYISNNLQSPPKNSQ